MVAHRVNGEVRIELMDHTNDEIEENIAESEFGELRYPCVRYMARTIDLPEQTFIEAVCTRNIPLAMFALVAGADVHWNDNYPLRRAVSENDFEMCKMLLDQGANVDKADCLAYAVTRNGADTLNLLISSDTCNCTNKQLVDLLFIACEHGFPKVAKVLLDYGCQIDQLNGWALFTALANGKFEVANTLIAHGDSLSKFKADKDICWRYGVSAEAIKIMRQNGFKTDED